MREQNSGNRLFLALLFGIVATPFWYGGNQPIVWASTATYFGLLTAIYEIPRFVGGQRHQVGLEQVRIPAICFSITVLWIFIQIGTFTPNALHHPLWQIAGNLLHRDVPGSITINRDLTYWTLIRLLTCGCVFWLTLQTCHSKTRAIALLSILAISGTLYAIYGILALEFTPHSMLWMDKPAYIGSVTSTFVNRNSFATFAGLCLLISIGLYINSASELVANFKTADKRPFVALMASMTNGGGIWLIAASILSASLVLTGSRAGVVSTMGAIVFRFSLTRFQKYRNSSFIFSASLIMAATFCIAIAIFGDYLSMRLQEIWLNGYDRLAVYNLTLTSIFNAPWLGYGYGTFSQIFPMYRDTSIVPVGIWDRAHDTYLEIFQGIGIPVAIIFLSGLLILIIKCLQATLSSRRATAVEITTLSASALVFMHTFVDFSIQMHGIAVFWTSLLAAGVSRSSASKKTSP